MELEGNKRRPSVECDWYPLPHSGTEFESSTDELQAFFLIKGLLCELEQVPPPPADGALHQST